MTDVPRDPLLGGMDDEADAILDDLDEDENKDKRLTKRRFDQYIEKPGELSDSEDEEENAANGVRPQPNHIRRRNETNFRGLDVADSGIESGLATPHEPSSVADEDIDMGGDTRMGEGLETGTGSPSAAGPGSRAEEPALEPPEVTVNGHEQPTSAPMSELSPKAGEDITMEDVPEPAPEVSEPKEPEEVGQPEQGQPEQQGQPEPEQTEAPAQDAPQEENKPAEEPVEEPAEAPAAPEPAAEPSPPKAESPKAPEPAEPAKETTEAPKESTPAAAEQAPPKESTPEKPEEPSKQEE